MDIHQYEDGCKVAVETITAGQLSNRDEIPGHTGPHLVERVDHLGRLVTAKVRDDSGRIYSVEFNMDQELLVIR